MEIPEGIRFAEALAQFRDMLSSELCLSRNTIASYLSDIVQFIRWNDSSSFTKDSLQRYLSSEGLTNASMRRKVSSIKAWRDFCNSEMNLNIDIEIPKIKLKRTVPEIMSNEDAQKLLGSENQDLRLKTIIILLHATGMRISELLSMEYRDVAQVVERGARNFSIIGKGSKERMIFLDEVSAVALRDYCAKKAIKKGNIWGGISRQHVYTSLKKLSRGLSVAQSRVYPHSFRHRLGSNLVQAGLSLVELQKVLGHAHINTTSIYTHLEDDLTYNMVLERHPLGKKVHQGEVE